MFTDPRAGIVEFLPLCDAYVEGMAKANAKSKATYRSNFANPAVTKLLQGRSVLDVAQMDAEVKTLLNKTLGGYSDDYRGNVRRIITGTLDECVSRGIIPRHTLTGIELAPRIVTAEQYEQQNKGMVPVTDDTVRDARRRDHRHRHGHASGRSAPASCPAWASPHGSSARWDCGSGKRWESASPTSGPRADGTRYLHLCWQASENGRELEPLSTARQATSATSPSPTWCGTWSRRSGRPAVPRPERHPVHALQHGRGTGSAACWSTWGSAAPTRTRCATSSPARPLTPTPASSRTSRQVLGHDSVETTLRFYIHASANAEQRIGAMMNARWTARPSRRPA